MLLFLAVSSQQCEGTFACIVTLEGERIKFIRNVCRRFAFLSRHHIPEKRNSQPHSCENPKTSPPPTTRQVYNYCFSGFCVLLARTAEVQQAQKDFKTLFRLLMDPIPAAVRPKTWVFSRSQAGIADSNPAGGMDVCLLRLFCVVR